MVAMKHNLPRTPQISSDELEFRLNRGQELVLCEDTAKRKRLAATYRLGSGDISDYQNSARFFWMSNTFPHKWVTKLPWSVLLELSRPTKDEALRIKVSFLCMLWADARSRNVTPSPYAFPTEKPLVVAVLDHPEIYREDVRTLFAQAKHAGAIDLPLTNEDKEYIDRPMPDLISRVRQDKNIVLSKSVELAIIEVKSIASNALSKAEHIEEVDRTREQALTVLNQVQEYLETLKSSDDTIIIDSLKAHATSLERRLHDALNVNEDLLAQIEQRDQTIKELRGTEAENEMLRGKLSTVLTCLDLVYEQLRADTNSVVVEVTEQKQEARV